MVAVSASLVLTLAFLRTQTTVLQISRNGQRRDLAQQAAQTGAAVALERLHAPDWQGVGERPTGVVHSDGEGSARFAAEFRPVETVDGQSLGEVAALHLLVVSTGTWQAASNPGEVVERSVEVTVRLQPRVAGRTVRPGDSAAAVDTAPNPGDYDAIQRYALFAAGGSTSLSLDPGDRIEGNLWLARHLELYRAPGWSGNVRKELLESIGAQLVTSGTDSSRFQHPHPLGGEIVFFSKPRGRVRDELEWLRVPWTQTAGRLGLPDVQFAPWRSYRLYEGGLEHRAVEVGSTLRNIALRPTPENPLGVFYRDGSIRLEDNVAIEGTLVASGRVTIAGAVHIAAFNWRGAEGAALVPDVGLWPRLPAVFADELAIERDAQSMLEGPVVVRKGLTGAGGDLEYVPAAEVSVTGTATASPRRQPHSLVQVGSGSDLSQVANDGSHSIWLENGSSGNWYPIVGLDAGRGQLTVIGEVGVETPVPFRIGRTRRRFVDIRGPVCGERHAINSLPAWSVPTDAEWDALHDEWKDTEGEGSNSSISFMDWLADPANFTGWPHPLSEHGLKLEPTFHLRSAEHTSHRWSPPLFKAYQGTGSEASHAGYRWQVIAWREVP